MWKPRVVEIILVVCALLACAGVAVPVFTRAGDNADRLQCLDNLRRIGEAMRAWSEQHDYALPPGLNALWDKGHGLIADPAVFRCPGDGNLLPPPGAGSDFSDPRQLSYGMTERLFPTDPPNKVVVADKRDASLADGTARNTGNHSHRFTNVLFNDGSVRSCESPFLPPGVGSETGSIYIRETGDQNDTYIE